jgi:PEP-CTERM motif
LATPYREFLTVAAGGGQHHRFDVALGQLYERETCATSAGFKVSRAGRALTLTLIEGSRAMTRRTTYLTSAAILAIGAISAPSAQAAYVITFQQVGPNVVETGSGFFDLTDLSVGAFGITRDAEVDPARGRVFSGVFTDANTSFADPPDSFVTFGPGSPTLASATTGGPVGFQSGVADITTLIFPADYTSGATLSDSSTYLGATISSLGLTPGEYVVDWGSGAHADSLTIDVVSPTAVPEPSTWAMMLIGFAGVALAGYRRAKAGDATLSRA